MLDAESGGVGGARGAADLERGIGALKRFHQRVTALLAEFESGEGGNGAIAAQQVPRSSFSGAGLPFAEADGFFGQYHRVHAELVSLSKSLGDQIEMLTLGVHAADVGFDNVEEETRQRFHTIQARLDGERTAQEKREAAQTGKPAEPARDDDTALPTDLR